MEDYIKVLKDIACIKKTFEDSFEKQLHVLKVPCPLFVKSSSGLQDELTGTEQAVSFMKGREKFEIVQSLAKWKREALGRYGFEKYEGIYTDMKAIRKDEEIDEIHSLLVEQWDWEKVIDKEDRNIDYLKKTVNEIYSVILSVAEKFDVSLAEQVYFIDSQDLEDLYPDDTPKIREQKIVQKYKTVFIMRIGGLLNSGIEHDLRSPDYDDWNLNGDLLIWDDILNKEIEITSMGIRVDENSLEEQLKAKGCLSKLNLPYHDMVKNKKLPYTIGGGIGVSRIYLLMLQKKHIAEVQASSWDNKTLERIKKYNIL